MPYATRSWPRLPPTRRRCRCERSIVRISAGAHRMGDRRIREAVGIPHRARSRFAATTTSPADDSPREDIDPCVVVLHAPPRPVPIQPRRRITPRAGRPRHRVGGAAQAHRGRKPSSAAGAPSWNTTPAREFRARRAVLTARPDRRDGRPAAGQCPDGSGNTPCSFITWQFAHARASLVM